MTENNIVRQYMKITGQVQGVGFRYRARYAAEHLGVTGWVKNLWDRSVEMEAQGTMEQIHQMLKTINQSPYIRIEWIDRKEIPIRPHDTGFHVR